MSDFSVPKIVVANPEAALARPAEAAPQARRADARGLAEPRGDCRAALISEDEFGAWSRALIEKRSGGSSGGR